MISPIRSLLAGLRLAYLPKIGVAYEYAMDGPFGATLVPQEVSRGYVRYLVYTTGGAIVDSSTSFSTWAMMCRERPQ